MEVFHRKKSGERKLLVKEKDCSRQGHFPLGGRAGGLITQITSSSLGDKEDPGDSYLIHWCLSENSRVLI